MSTPTTHSLTVEGVGPVEVTVTDAGSGHPILILHGGAGPQSVSAFADLLVTTHGARVIAPTHPGFGGTPRPDSLVSMASLARVYVALLDQLDLKGVTVIGNSIGGWIAAEMALLGSPRISSLIFVDAVGIEVEGHPIADFFSLTLDQVAEFSYHHPDRFRIDPTTMTEAQRTVMAGNRASLAIYGGQSMIDPSLRGRLANITVPTLVVWGDSDRIADPEYGRAWAAAIPGATFILLTATGHVPQIETPKQLLTPVWDFAAAHAGRESAATGL
ncbi:MAG TPA: alpha/beta hydrolase [Candidatus Dormibacteraeota bacterium]|jgi:pimeloyl-ACP methyl ester carboxylesterase|nr:alpha/beta hydrolase [Candidatus Dormibacteraeota bacterium]